VVVVPQVFCDGRPATAAELAGPALVNDGHFTTMQVRGGAVQGLDLHLQRLDHASRTLFAQGLPPSRVRAECAAALAAARMCDATLRVTVHCTPQATLRMLVSLAPPAAPDPRALRLKSFDYVRTLPEVKHVGTFPLFHFRRRAREAGCDDALFVAPDGRVCEGSVWNLALWDGMQVVWPQGPALRGTCERLLQHAFERAGVPQRTREVRLQGLPPLAGIACNSRGVQPLASVDGHPMADPAALLALATTALAGVPWDPFEPTALDAPTVAPGGPL